MSNDTIVEELSGLRTSYFAKRVSDLIDRGEVLAGQVLELAHEAPQKLGPVCVERRDRLIGHVFDQETKHLVRIRPVDQAHSIPPARLMALTCKEGLDDAPPQPGRKSCRSRP